MCFLLLFRTIISFEFVWEKAGHMSVCGKKGEAAVTGIHRSETCFLGFP